MRVFVIKSKEHSGVSSWPNRIKWVKYSLHWLYHCRFPSQGVQVPTCGAVMVKDDFWFCDLGLLGGTLLGPQASPLKSVNINKSGSQDMKAPAKVFHLTRRKNCQATERTPEGHRLEPGETLISYSVNWRVWGSLHTAKTKSGSSPHFSLCRL